MISNILKARPYCIGLCIVMLVNVCPGEEQKKHVHFVEKTLFLLLDIPTDATDQDIISKLDSPQKIAAMQLIVRRQITDALPKLHMIVEDKNEAILNRSHAARTLLYFKDRGWIKAIRSLYDSYDAKQFYEIDCKIHLAGTLAMIGDYSPIEMVLKGTVHENYLVRIQAARQLAEYNDPNSPVSDIASDALVEMAKSDSDVPVRKESIFALEKIVQKKMEYRNKLLEAVEANVDSIDKDLKALSQERKGIYTN